MGSVTVWLEQLKEGEAVAVQRIWQDYFARLVGLARARLHGIPRQATDEEDVALSAFDSFCRGAEQGRFPKLLDRADLWQVLVMITARKSAALARHELRRKRSPGRGRSIRHVSALAPRDDEDADAFAGLIDDEPTPQFAAEIAEECRLLLERLEDRELQSVAVWKMEGHSNDEIAGRLGAALFATVERKLKLIREIWEDVAP